MNGIPPTASTGAPPEEILVVDDDEDLRHALGEVLEEAGYRVRAAANGRDALAQMVGGFLPDLILLDLLMPEMDGWGLMAELKARPALATIPVVVVSAGGDRLLNSAPVCAGHLTTPVPPARLLEVVKRCLLLRPASAGPPRPA